MEDVCVMKDEELMFEETETSLTLGGPGQVVREVGRGGFKSQNLL